MSDICRELTGSCLIPGLMVHHFPENGRMRYGQVLHGSTITTEAIHRAIKIVKRASEGAVQALWDQSEDLCEIEEARCGSRFFRPSQKSQKLSLEDQAIIVAFRQHTASAVG